MNAQKVNSWLTLTANIGVVIGLVLLLAELQQNNDLARAQVHQARSDAYVANRLNIVSSEYFYPTYQKFLEAGGFVDLTSVDKLTSTEAGQMREFFVAFHRDYDNLFYQYQQGYLDEEYYRSGLTNSIRLFAPWWKKLDIFESGSRRPSFQAEIDELLQLTDNTEIR